jgi:hypothetical protein
MDNPRQRLHLSGVSEAHEKGKPQRKLRFLAALAAESLWKGKAIIASKPTQN